MAQADVDKKLEEKFKAANQKLEEIQKVGIVRGRSGMAKAVVDQSEPRGVAALNTSPTKVRDRHHPAFQAMHVVGIYAYRYRIQFGGFRVRASVKQLLSSGVELTLAHRSLLFPPHPGIERLPGDEAIVLSKVFLLVERRVARNTITDERTARCPATPEQGL